MRFSLPQDTNVRFVAGISELSMTGLGRNEPDGPPDTGRSAQKILGPRHGSLVDPFPPVTSVCFGEAYFADAISASTAAGKPLGNGTPEAA
jgi:hypothetical protein